MIRTITVRASRDFSRGTGGPSRENLFERLLHVNARRDRKFSRGCNDVADGGVSKVLLQVLSQSGSAKEAFDDEPVHGPYYIRSAAARFARFGEPPSMRAFAKTSSKTTLRDFYFQASRSSLSRSCQRSSDAAAF
jgi:hypothetical protein